MSKATLRFIRVSPTKARLIAREVQGMNAELALAALEFMPNKAAGILAKVIASAVANGDFEPEEVIITSCRVDKAAVMKRWRPRARGTATRIIKPTAHIFVEVTEASAVESAKAAAKEAAKAAPKSEKRATAKKPAAKKPATKKAVAEEPAAKKPAEAKTPKSAPEKRAAKKPATKKPAADKAAVKGDDLTKIKGIGKVYASKLQSEGIHTFEDVANMTQAQIDMMEEKYSFRGDFKDSIADAKNFVTTKEA